MGLPSSLSFVSASGSVEGCFFPCDRFWGVTGVLDCWITVSVIQSLLFWGVMVGRQLTTSFGSSLILEVGDSEVKVTPVESIGSCSANGSSMSSPLSAVKDILLVIFDGCH